MTRLQRMLHGPEAPTPPGPLDVLERARRHFVAGERIDMGGLAAETGVSRATLNRWVGSREELLGEVLGSLLEAAFSRAERDVRGTGRKRVLRVLRVFFDGVLAPGPFRDFVGTQPELAIRLCTSQQAGVQQRLIERTARLLREESVADDPEMTSLDRAYAIVRIGESFVYNDVITGAEPNLDPASVVWDRILLDS